MRTITYMQIKEILRLHELHELSVRDIAKSVGCGKTSVSEHLKACRELKITYQAACAMKPGELGRLIHPSNLEAIHKKKSDWAQIDAEFNARCSRKNLQYPKVRTDVSMQSTKTI